MRVVDLEGGKEYRTSVENVAVETYYYDVEIEGLRLSPEDWLAQLEGDAAPVIQRVIADPARITSLSLEEEVSLSRFIAALWFRTPAFRQWEEQITSTMALQIKDIIRGQIYHQHERNEADALWEDWKDKPNHWWMGQVEPVQPASGTNHMLAEVQGFANLVRAMPWRTGRTIGSLGLYTSDNPVSRYLSPVRPWWDGGAFTSFTYYVPLAPDVLLRIYPMPFKNDPPGPLEPQGERRYRDFSDWEACIACHVITNEATKYLYGEGLVVTRNCARECLERIGQANLQFAIRYLGFDPRPPKFPSKPLSQ